MTRSPLAVRVLLFASAREGAGRPQLDWPVPPEGLTVRELVSELRAKFPRLRSVLAVSRFVRNETYVDDLETRLRSGDEFAIHPPYGGG